MKILELCRLARNGTQAEVRPPHSCAPHTHTRYARSVGGMQQRSLKSGEPGRRRQGEPAAHLYADRNRVVRRPKYGLTTLASRTLTNDTQDHWAGCQQCFRSVASLEDGDEVNQQHTCMPTSTKWHEVRPHHSCVPHTHKRYAPPLGGMPARLQKYGEPGGRGRGEPAAYLYADWDGAARRPKYGLPTPATRTRTIDTLEHWAGCQQGFRSVASLEDADEVNQQHTCTPTGTVRHAGRSTASPLLRTAHSQSIR